MWCAPAAHARQGRLCYEADCGLTSSSLLAWVVPLVVCSRRPRQASHHNWGRTR
nr:MAG TPA: hypothetical protein [Caudoviricetes sp.]